MLQSGFPTSVLSCSSSVIIMFERVLWASYTRLEAYENPMPLTCGRSCTRQRVKGSPLLHSQQLNILVMMGKLSAQLWGCGSISYCRNGISPFFIRAKVTHVALLAWPQRLHKGNMAREDLLYASCTTDTITTPLAYWLGWFVVCAPLSVQIEVHERWASKVVSKFLVH
jgi:hypothetical protein